MLLIPLVPDGVEACEASATAIDEAAEGGEGSVGEEEHAAVPAEQAAAKPVIQRNKYGGGGFVSVLVLGLLYSIVNAGMKLSATDAPAPAVMAPSPSVGFLSPSPSSNSSSGEVFEWQCEKEVKNSCDEAVDGQEDNEEAGQGPDERR